MSGRRWLIVLALVWAVLLIAAGVWSAANDPPTVREQSSLERGRARVAEAVELVRRAAGPGVDVDVRPPEVTTGCELSVTRSGSELDQVVVLTVPRGEEAAVLDRLAERLPPDWEANRFRDPERLVADAGEFVSVRAEVEAPGEVRLTLGTGCRPGDEAR